MEKKKIAILSNVTVDLITAKLRKKYDFFIPEGFDTWIQEAINVNSSLYSGELDGIVILIDGTEARSWKDQETAADRLFLWKQAVSAITDKVEAIPVFISTIDFRENRIKSYSERKSSPELSFDWYTFIQGLVEQKSNVFVLDIAETILEVGRKQFYSNKMWYMSSMPYSRDGLASVVKEIDRALDAAFTSRKKIIVLDLDNTLWGGVIGEDGIEGIELSDHKEGQRFYDFQYQLLKMKERGTVLAINSKNNEEDAEDAINNHPNMILRDRDFVSRKINWNNKAQNIKEIAQELNITEGGFIFIDDNPVEREIVKGECPEIVVPDFPEDTSELMGFAENIWEEYIRPLRVLAEDSNKTQMYQSDAKRKREKADSLNLDDYIARLGISVDIHRMKPEELDRVTQLCNKTNQFNLTTKRYTKAEIEKIADQANNAVYVVHTQDKYGDNGIVSAVILLGEENTAKIDTFLMSCRVMGRKIEDVITDAIAASLEDKALLIGEYIPTAKNKPVADLYEKLGFKLVSDEGGHKKYELDLHGYNKKSLEIFKDIVFDNN